MITQHSDIHLPGLTDSMDYKRLQRYGFPREPHGAADEFVAPGRSKLVTP